VAWAYPRLDMAQRAAAAARMKAARWPRGMHMTVAPSLRVVSRRPQQEVKDVKEVHVFHGVQCKWHAHAIGGKGLIRFVSRTSDLSMHCISEGNTMLASIYVYRQNCETFQQMKLTII
jgi:hypothetical protein